MKVRRRNGRKIHVLYGAEQGNTLAQAIWTPWGAWPDEIGKNKLVKSFDYDSLKDVGSVKLVLEVSSKANFRSATHDIEPLGLVHNDVWGKMIAKSLEEVEYFLTFIDDNTRFVWVYPPKHNMKCFINFCNESEKSFAQTTGESTLSTKFEEHGRWAGTEIQRGQKTTTKGYLR